MVLVVLKNVQGSVNTSYEWLGYFNPSTAAQYILINMTILGVSKDGNLQLYGQKKCLN